MLIASPLPTEPVPEILLDLRMFIDALNSQDCELRGQLGHNILHLKRNTTMGPLWSKVGECEENTLWRAGHLPSGQILVLYLQRTKERRDGSVGKIVWPPYQYSGIPGKPGFEDWDAHPW